MNILGKLFGKHPPASLNSVTFDVSRYADQGVSNGSHVWFLPEGGGAGLYYFPLPPDLPNGLSTVAPLRDFYIALLGAQSQLVDCRVHSLEGVPAVWLIAKGKNDQTGGAVYLGSLTIPFRDFSFVIKIQCQEQHATGMREALLIDEALSKGTARIQGDSFVPDGWSFDDEQFDSRFPQHPLSRLRRELRLIASSLRIAPEVRSAPPFHLPQNDS